MDDFEPPLICKTTTVGMVIVHDSVVFNWPTFPTMPQNADISTSNFDNFLRSLVSVPGIILDSGSLLFARVTLFLFDFRNVYIVAYMRGITPEIRAIFLAQIIHSDISAASINRTIKA